MKFLQSGEGGGDQQSTQSGCDKTRWYSYLPSDGELQGHLNGQIIEGRHKYRSHLYALDSCRPDSREPQWELEQWKIISSPLVSAEWRKHLRSHPDTEFAAYIIRGISQGFRLGFQRKKAHIISAKANMPVQNPEVVSEYIQREVSLGRGVHPPSRGISRPPTD